ncbi:MAG: hypothetical protein COV48_08530 [Elusimicrobia bacterium CG11_big_fil_rev_8_21_14_0_20_64_6]|nr:MAG: hypothetical protein COV48_08530 [Elusimicrobia bacterium CG11_big_fil_rev_8_21_14_0_20_64_6]
MNSAREWVAFGGAAFVLMGASLAAAARRNAEDALSWERQWRIAVGAPEPARDEGQRRNVIVLAYRFGGLFLAGVGVGLLYSVMAGQASFGERVGGRETMLGGVFFTLCGGVMGINAWLRLGRRAPRFLEGELLDESAPPPLGERVATVCSHGMIALFLVFGLRLLREGLR